MSDLARRALDHPIRATALALFASAVALVTVFVIAAPHGVTRTLSHPHVGWLAIAAVCEMASLPGYAWAYRAIVVAYTHRQLTLHLALRMVLLGFGLFATLGGFSLDREGLRRLGGERRSVEQSVLALALLELVVLAAAAAVTAIVLLAVGSNVAPTMLWPWVIGVPVGAVIAGLVTQIHAPSARAVVMLVNFARSAMSVVAHSLRSPPAYLGIALYFAFDIASLDAALRGFGLSVGSGRLLIAYASGFLLTRRTLPLGSAAVVDVLLSLSLSWVGEPLSTALIGVAAYRILNLAFVACLALVARNRLRPLMRSAESQSTPSGGS